MRLYYRSVAQLVEHRSPKPRVEGSSPSWPESLKCVSEVENEEAGSVY